MFANKILNEFFDVQAKYKAKYGEESLEYTDYYDPIHDTDDEALKRTIKRMEKAIKNNKPFPKFIPPEGMNIIY